MFDKKFEFETHHHDHSVNFPKDINVNVHEHRAPTDDSVRLLKEMEEHAIDDLVLKITEVRPNKFSYNIFFVRYATMDIMPKGIVYFKFNCNGKDYVRKVTCSSSMLSLAAQHGPQAGMYDLHEKLQRFILFEASFLIAQVLFDIDNKVLFDLFEHAKMGDPMTFDLETLRDSLENDWEMPMSDPTKRL